jgi:predicted ATP-grasp superfamily ATP-dependent carboligase/alpha-beta hydrolase superfamily lysophospholipase
MPICRQPAYIGSSASPLFTVLHSDATALPRNCIAVICPPLGYEYTHSHRSVRHLADALARNGIPALRLDYQGTGDSPGSDLDPDRLSHWLQSIRLAVAAARAMRSDAKVCLLGIRLGATLAAIIAAEVEIDWLVMWFPATSGRRYVREQQVVAKSMQTGESEEGSTVQAAGFMLTQQTMDELKTIDLLKMQNKVPNKTPVDTLLIQRDDLSDDNSLRDHLVQKGGSVDTITCPGFAEMIAQPILTQVPIAAIDTTVNWLMQHTAMMSVPFAMPATLPAHMQYGFTTSDNKDVNLIDTACRFGENDYLFGIHTQLATSPASLPMIVMFNAGVVHRVGPNRLYTLLSRNMAALGFPVFRCDIEGLGDSVLRAHGRENHPYPDGALKDAETILDFLRKRFGAQQFILMGLCSGAYLSFTTGLSKADHSITELLLINPLTFKWTEGDSLDTDNFRHVAYYRGSMRSGSRWLKLLRGQVNFLKIGKVVLSHLRTQFQSYSSALIERIYPKAGSLLSNQLRELFGRKLRVSLFVSSGDPGWDMVTANARQAAKLGLKRDSLSIQFIPDADHTFTSEAARMRLVNGLLTHLQKRYGDARNQSAPVATGKKMARPEVIVLSRNVTGLETIRCLAQAGIKVHAIYFKKRDPVRYSRYCRKDYFDDSAQDEQALLSHIIAYAKQIGNCPIVVPTSDTHALMLANSRDTLAPYCKVMTSDYTSLTQIIHKHNLHTQAELAGLEIIPAIVAPTLDEVAAWSNIHPAPYLVKPFYTGVLTSRLKQKNAVLSTRAALLDYVKEGDMQSLIVQRIIPGGDGYIFDCYGYCNGKGEVVSMATKRRLRQNLPDYGTCTMGEIPAYLDENTQTTLYAHTRQLFRQVKYQGIFGVEWLYDQQQKKFYVIDFNARPFMSIGHVAAAGLNLPALAYADMVGDDLSHIPQMPRMKHIIGVDMLRDMESALTKKQQGKLSMSSWLGSLLKCRYFYYSDWHDPGPAILRMMEIMRRGLFYTIRSIVK